MNGDITDRGDFDRAVQERFPNVRRSRRESARGWADTFTVGFLEAVLRVHDGEEALYLYVLGVPEDPEGKKPQLWRQRAHGWGDCMQALDDLRAKLLGTAHALFVGCRAKPKEVAEAVEEARKDELTKLWESTPNLNDIFG